MTDTLVSAHLVDTFTVNAWIWMTTVHVFFTVVTCINNTKQNVTFWGLENVQTIGQRHSPIHVVHVQLKITVHGKNIKEKRDFDDALLSTYMPFATTHLNHDVTLTFDLQHLTRSSVWDSEYFLSVVAFLLSDYPKWERLGESHFN